MGILDQLKQWFTQSNPTDVNKPENQESQVLESQTLNIDYEEISIDEQIETIETPISTPIYQSVPKTLQEQLNNLQDNAKLSLWPPHGEYPGPIIINNPVVLDGQGATIWATQGPVLSIYSHQVTLRNLRIEVTGEMEINTFENNNINCAILVKSNQQSNPEISFENIEVRGAVMGISEEEGEWQYPSHLNIGKIAHGQEYNFIWRIIVPVDCKIVSEISGIEFTPSLLTPGKNEVYIHIEKLPQDTLINGNIYLVSANFKRRISVTAHIFNSNDQDISISDHQVIWEAESWSSFCESIITENIPNISETIIQIAAEPEIKIIQPEEQSEERVVELPQPVKIDVVNTTEKENTSRNRTYKEVKPSQIFASAAEKLNQQQKQQSQVANSDNSPTSTPINPLFQSVKNNQSESQNQNTPPAEANDSSVINPIFQNYSPVNKSINSENVSEQNSSQPSNSENSQNNSQAQKRTQAKPNKIFMDKGNGDNQDET